MLVRLTFKLRTKSRLTELCCQHLFRYRSSARDLWNGSLASLVVHTSASHITISLIQFSWQRQLLQLIHHLTNQLTWFLHRQLSALNVLYIYKTKQKQYKVKPKQIYFIFFYIYRRNGRCRRNTFPTRKGYGPWMSRSMLLNIAIWEKQNQLNLTMIPTASNLRNYIFF